MLPWTVQPSLKFAVFSITGEWPAEGKKISCPHPAHADTNPSFVVYMQDGEFSYRCWSCGISGGDAASFLTDVLGLRGLDLERKLDELHADQKVDPPVKLPAPYAPDLNVRWLTIEQRLCSASMDRFVAYLDTKGLPDPEYLNAEWDWMPGDRPWTAVACPHWSGPLDCKLTGIKYRSLKAKSSEPGSSYPFLYGSWRDNGSDNVVLAEGETDTVTAASQLRGADVDVLGLPSGASQPIQREWVDRLRGRNLFLILDNDSAGRDATSRWRALFPDARAAILPDGGDFLSSKIPFRSLDWF
jgi:hypothetical protein